MRVLYVNHTSHISGAEHSMLVMLRAIRDQVTPIVACPVGPLADAVKALAVEWRPIPGTDLSARLHPVHTPRQMISVAAAAATVRRLARRERVDLIHANTPRAGLMALGASRRGSPGPIIHVRDSIPPGRLPRIMFDLLAARASMFISTSEFLKCQLRPGWPTRLVPNAIEIDRFDPEAVGRRTAMASLEIVGDGPVIGLVGQISPHKGQLDAIRALALVRRDHPTAQLVLVGTAKFLSAATRFDNSGYADQLRTAAAELGVTDATHFLGERTDIAGILAACDLLLVPSWYEPFGRVALEGMAMRVPVIATSVGGTSEIVRDGVDGLILEPRQPERWAHEISSLLDDAGRRESMGRAGRRRVQDEFSTDRHGAALMSAYTVVKGG